MAEKIVNVSAISREEWLEYRRRGIGGSDAACVLGLNPWKSRVELYADKRGSMPEKDDTEAMRLGRDLEDYVARRFCEATGKKVRRNNFMWKSSQHPCMLADVDREIVGENAGLECKTTQSWSGATVMKGEIPLTYYVQCMHYMSVMGYDKMYLAVLVFGRGFQYFEIGRDEGEISALVAAEESFWRDFIEGGVSPAPDGSQSAETAIKAMLDHDFDTGEIFMHERGADVREYVQLTQTIKQLSKNADAIKQSLQLALGEHGRGCTDEYLITWYPQTRATIDTKKLFRKYPDVYRDCIKTSTTRIFKVKGNEQNDI